MDGPVLGINPGVLLHKVEDIVTLICQDEVLADVLQHGVREEPVYDVLVAVPTQLNPRFDIAGAHPLAYRPQYLYGLLVTRTMSVQCVSIGKVGTL